MIKNAYKTLIALIVLLALSTNNVFAAECKGKSKSSCSSNSSCTWVSGYTKQDGKNVKGYCRAKGKSGDKRDTKSKAENTKNKKSKDTKSNDKVPKGKKSTDKKSTDKKSKDKKSTDNKSKDKNLY